MLTGKDIALVIKECKKSDVIHFEMGEMKIQFGLGKLKDAKDLVEASPMPGMPHVDLSPITDNELNTPEPQQTSFDYDDDLISDPAAWEKQQLAAGGSAAEE